MSAPPVQNLQAVGLNGTHGRRRAFVAFAILVTAILLVVRLWPLGTQGNNGLLPARSEWAGTFVEATEPKYRHTVNLRLDGSAVGGTYFYNQKKKVLDLRGQLTESHAFTVEEFLDGKKTGVFVGRFTQDWATASGTWTHADDGRRLQFNWVRVP